VSAALMMPNLNERVASSGPLAHLDRLTLERFGAEIDAIRDEVIDSRGERDRRYILRLIRIQRSLALGGRVTMLASLALHPWFGFAWASWPAFLAVLLAGSFALGLAKILENMEIGHNILHAQWDWMGDPEIQSHTWEWDNVCPSEQWRHSHNVVHHMWTNVMGKDRDVGYGMLRVTQRQRWSAFYAVQPFSFLLMMSLFEWFIAVHDLEISHIVSGKRPWNDARPLLKQVARKASRQVLKDYVLWPLLAGPFFLWILAGNVLANVMRNVWTFVIIFCGHFPAGVHHFRKGEVRNETRGHWYARQLLGSCNIEGGALFHVMSGNLSHQIEHHLFPDLPSNRYPELAPRVRAIAERYGLDYNTGSLRRQFGTTVAKVVRFAFPGPSAVAAA
jgi:NADPH-dependent stearoyl-CoA 9-desaturase